MPFRIRPFRKAEFETLWSINQICFAPELAYSRPELAFYMRRSGSFTLVAEGFLGKISDAAPEGAVHDAGFTARLKPYPDTKPGFLADREADNGENAAGAPQIFGFIVAELERKGKQGGRPGHIITIDVIPEGRRSGIGSALLDAAERQLADMGANSVTLETAVNNETALRFYKRKGYFVETTTPRYYSNQLDAFVMRKELVDQEFVARSS